MKLLFWGVFLCGTLLGIAGLLAFFLPAAYLNLHATLGFGPYSLAWVIDTAREKVMVDPMRYCDAPFLLSWHGSFGGGPVIPEGTLLPPGKDYSELVLIQSGIIRESTQIAKQAMAEFNVKLLSHCFGK